MSEYVAYFNGEGIPFSQVKIDLMDRGFLMGDVVFDVARTFNGKSFRMKAHIDRLYRSLKYIRLDPGLSNTEMVEVSEMAIKLKEPFQETVGDYTIWQFGTRGPGRWANDAGPPLCACRWVPLISAAGHISTAAVPTVLLPEPKAIRPSQLIQK